MRQYLKESFKYLLQPFENYALTLEYTARYFRFLGTKTNDIPELIGQSVRYIDEFFALLSIEDKQTRNER